MAAFLCGYYLPLYGWGNMDFLDRFEGLVLERILEIERKLEFYDQDERGMALDNKRWYTELLQINKHWLYVIQQWRRDGRYLWSSQFERYETGTSLQ